MVGIGAMPLGGGLAPATPPLPGADDRDDVLDLCLRLGPPGPRHRRAGQPLRDEPSHVGIVHSARYVL